MAFGFEVYNNNNELLVSSEDPLLQFEGEETIALPNARDVEFSSAYTERVYFSQPLSSDFLYFVRLQPDDGTAVARYGNLLFSNKTSLIVQKARLAAFINPATSGYGMEVYSADGTVTFSTQKPLFLIKQVVTVPSQGSVNILPADSYCIAYQSLGQLQPDALRYVHWVGGIALDNNRFLRHIAFPIGVSAANQAGPNSYYPDDFPVITA